MFKNTYQSGFLSILYSIGSKPLQIWDKQSKATSMQFTTATSSASPIRTSSHQSWKSWVPTLPRPSSPVRRTRRRPSASNYPSSSWSSRTYIPSHPAQKILHLRSAGPRWQKCTQTFPRIELPVNYPRQALYLHYAHAPRWGLEPDSVQSIRLYA